MARNKKRADGRYKVSVYVGVKNEKKQYKYFYSDSMREAQEQADEYRKKLRSVSSPSDALFRHLSAAWLDNKKKTVGAAQARTLEGFVHVLNDDLGDVPVLEITEEMLTDFLADLAVQNPRTGKPSSQSTINKYFQVIQAVFRFSRIQPDPSVFLSAPRGEKQHDRRALTADEQRHVVELEHRAQLPAMLAMYAGLRRGELTALRWSDVDLKARRITVNKSFDFTAGKVKSPKTDAGRRTIYILPPLLEYLSTVERRTGLVVTNAHGDAMSITAWRQLWDSYMTDMDVAYAGRVKYSARNEMGVYTVPTFGLHELRHTYATILHDAGVDVKTAQYWLGHSDAATTMNIYTHLSTEQESAAQKTVNSYFAGQNAGQESP